MVFNQEYEFCSENCIILEKLNLLPSEAWLFSIMQNWKKSLISHGCLPRGLTSFEYSILRLHTLNYHTYGLYYGPFILRYLINVGPLINVGMGNFIKSNKRRPWNKRSLGKNQNINKRRPLWHFSDPGLFITSWIMIPILTLKIVVY